MRGEGVRRVVSISDARVSGGAEVYLERLAAALDRTRFEPAAILDPSPALDATAERFAALGAPVERLRVKGALDVAGLARLRDAVRALRADLAHVNLPSTYDGACSLFIVAARSGGARVVTTEHVAAIGRSRRRRALKALATRSASRVIAVSRANARHLGRHGVPERLVRVVPNGVPDPPLPGEGERERLRAELGLGPGAVLLGSIGSLIERKGHHLLLDALATLEGRYHLVVIGEGDRRRFLEARAGERGLSSRVTFLGHRSDAARWTGCLDLHVLASRLEGMPLCVLEAMAARVPTVAFRIDGLDEIIGHGESGLLAEPGDVRSLAEAIVRAADPPTRARMASAARALYESRFTLEVMARATEAVYEEALA